MHQDISPVPTTIIGIYLMQPTALYHDFFDVSEKLYSVLLACRSLMLMDRVPARCIRSFGYSPRSLPAGVLVYICEDFVIPGIFLV